MTNKMSVTTTSVLRAAITGQLEWATQKPIGQKPPSPGMAGTPTFLKFSTPDEILGKGPAAVQQWQWQEPKLAELKPVSTDCNDCAESDVPALAPPYRNLRSVA